MPISDCKALDPRIRRTRHLLQQALQSLLQKKTLDEILVQDITDAATVNRATFYDHYTDKFALFEAMVGHDFHTLLMERTAQTEQSCDSALGGVILTVCEFLQQTHGGPDTCTKHSTFTPLMESAVTTAIRRVFLSVPLKCSDDSVLSREIVVNTASWAIYGAAKEWFHTPKRPPANVLLPSLVQLISPLLHGNLQQSV